MSQDFGECFSPLAFTLGVGIFIMAVCLLWPARLVCEAFEGSNDG